MKKTTAALLLTLGLGTATLFAYGGADGQNMQQCKHHTEGKFKHHRGDGMMKTLQELNLSDTQKMQLKQIRQEQKAQRQANKQAMQARMKPDMAQFMSADKFDKEAYKAQMTQRFEAKRAMMEAKREQMLEKRAEKMEKIFMILTPEQRIKWIELSKQSAPVN